MKADKESLRVIGVKSSLPVDKHSLNDYNYSHHDEAA